MGMKNKKRILIAFIAILVVFLVSCKKSVKGSDRIYAFTNGFWFDGESFEKGDWYTVGNTLTRKKPGRVDSTFDLEGGYVVPPFGEGHNHILETDPIDTYIQLYLDKGVFYVKDQGTSLYTRSLIEHHLNKPASFDYISPNQGFTATGGHPIQIALQLRQLGILPRDWTMEDIDGQAALIVDSIPDIEKKWEILMAGNPDFVKIFLQFSEAYHTRKDNPEYLYNRAMNPEFIPLIVKLANKNGLKVSAHTFSAKDFFYAVRGGVNQIAHLPGPGYDGKMAHEVFLISDDDAALAAKNDVTVITTIFGLVEERGRDYIENILLPNLKILRKHNVKILIGSDQFRKTSAIEVKALYDIGFFSNLELLKMWCEDTPLDIFPNRKIGFLKEGYEASFLVLKGNPIKDFKYTSQITFRMKQGHIITVKEYEFPKLGG